MRNEEIVDLTISQVSDSILSLFDDIKSLLLMDGFRILWKSGLNCFLLVKSLRWVSTHSLLFLTYPREPQERAAGSTSKGSCTPHPSEHFVVRVVGLCRAWPWQGSMKILNQNPAPLTQNENLGHIDGGHKIILLWMGLNHFIQWPLDFILGGSQITADGDCSHEIKRCILLGRKVMTNLDSILKSREITLSTRLSSQGYDFCSSHVWM